MCFIKNLCIGIKVLISDDVSESELMAPLLLSSQQFKSSTSISCASNFPPNFPYFFGESVLLGKVLDSVQSNSHLLMKLHQKIEFSHKLLKEAHQMAEEQYQLQSSKSVQQDQGWKSSENIVQKLFGDRLYRYKLKLRHKFPNTIYKERNISMNVELLDSSQKLVMNSNLMSLCVAACDVTGQWICENEEGEYFLQGKTEVELYHDLPKRCEQTVREWKGGYHHLPKTFFDSVFYVSRLEQRVNVDEIEPLLIKDVAIRAKKKTH